MPGSRCRGGYLCPMAGPARPTILLVEDERSIAEPFAGALEREGFEARDRADGARGARALPPPRRRTWSCSTSRCPDGDGREVCRELRRESAVPIIMLTARGTETDRIVGPGARRRRLRRQAVQLRRGDRPHPRRPAPHRPRHGDGPAAAARGRRPAPRPGRTQRDARRRRARPLAQGVRPARAAHARRRPRRHARGPDVRRLGRELVRLDQDARRARRLPAAQARRRRRGPALPAHRPRRRLPLRGREGRPG